MINLLSREEQDRLHQRYRKNDLFRHWAPFLMQLELEQDEIDVSNLWWQVEKEIDILRRTEHNRDEMIVYLFMKMREDFKTVKPEGGATIVRTEVQAELTAVTVMCVMMTMLLNAVLPGHEKEDFDNKPICLAIVNLLRNHPHFILLMDRFFKRKVDNRGNKIVIKPSDPMKEDAMFEDMEETAQEEINGMKRKLHELTQGLKPLMAEAWDDWTDFCNRVCMNQELLGLLTKVVPSGNEWGINQKMVCNMLGLFKNEKCLNLSISAMNRALSKKQLRSYISNHADFGGSDSAMTKAQHNLMKNMLSED